MTTDGSRNIVNGTFDWVYEEELFCRDGLRWSPDGKQIAYWQLNSEGVKEIQAHQQHRRLYPVITSFPYPKAGEMNSAARVGVVKRNGRRDTLVRYCPAIRATTICREWSGPQVPMKSSSNNSIGLQNTNIVMLGDARTGQGAGRY